MRQRLAAALDAAVEAHDRRRMATLRLIRTAVEDRDTAARTAGKERVADEDILRILLKMLAQREDSARLYEAGGRLELAAEEREETAIIAAFLPERMSADDIKAACTEVISDIGAHGLRDTGRCMDALRTRYSGKMDFGAASGVVKSMLK
jgi:hypothetical protein